MATVLEQLLELGFDEVRAKKAVNATKSRATIDAAMDWLLEHQNDPDIDIPAAAAAAVDEDMESSAVEVKMEPMVEPNAATGANGAVAKSMKCSECGKLFKSEEEVQFHAAKTNHVSFEESTDEVKPLSEEEKKARMESLQQKLLEKRATEEEMEKKQTIELEKNRRRHGQDIQEAKKRLADKEMQEIAEDRRRQKQEDRLAKQRVLEQIQADRDAKKRQLEGRSAAEETPKREPEKVEPPPVRNYDECKIQFRFPNGQTKMQTFQAKEPLSAVRLYAMLNRTDGMPPDTPMRLMQNFPHRVFTDEDMEKPISELGLAPSAVLIVTKTL